MIRRIAPPFGIALVAIVGLLMACGGGEEPSSPTSPPPTSNAPQVIEPQTEGPLDDSSVGLILLGPAGDWLYPRVAEVTAEEIDDLVDQYASGLDEIRQTLDASATVATGWITPPFPMRAETNYGGFPQAFVRDAHVDALIPSPTDLIQGADHIWEMDRAIGCPLVATDLRSPRINATFNALSHTEILDDVTLIARTEAAMIQVVDLTGDISSERRPLTAPGRNERSIYLHPPIPGSPLPEEWSFTDDILSLSIPTLESQQVAVVEIRGLAEGNPSVTTRIEDLLPSDSPLLNQPDARSITIGQEVTQQIFEVRVADMIGYENISESIVSSSDVEGWPAEAEQGRAHVYELQMEGHVTHRLFAVKVEPGEGFLRSVFAVVCDPQWENPEVVWIYEPIIVQTPLVITDLVNGLVNEFGLEHLPENPPQMLGAEIQWRAIRRGLSGAAVLLDSLRRDLPQ